MNSGLAHCWYHNRSPYHLEQGDWSGRSRLCTSISPQQHHFMHGRCAVLGPLQGLPVLGRAWSMQDHDVSGQDVLYLKFVFWTSAPWPNSGLHCSVACSDFKLILDSCLPCANILFGLFLSFLQIKSCLKNVCVTPSGIKHTAFDLTLVEFYF